MTKWKYLKGSEKDFDGAPNWATVLTLINNSYCWDEHEEPLIGVSRYQDFNNLCGIQFYELDTITGGEIIAQREPITECTFQDGVVFDAPISMSLNEFRCRQQSLNANDSDIHINGIPISEFSAKADVEVVKYDPTKVDGEQLVKCGELKIDGKMHDATINKYTRDCKGVQVDVYDVLQAFNVTNPALQHLIKKSLCVGIRGHKTKQQDLQDIIDSAIRAKELESK